MFMNEHDVEQVGRLVIAARLDNLIVGARVLDALVEWTNSCSDGWVYWQKPRKAATKLMEMLDDRMRNQYRQNGLMDCTDAELRQALVPIKTFLTKQGVDYYAELPWAVILPQRVDA